MSGAKAALVWSDDFITYDFGLGHPLRPRRLTATRQLMEAYGLLARPEVQVVDAPLATEAEVLMVHTREYYDTVAALSGDESRCRPWDHGFSSTDNPAFRGMLEASLRYTGASLQAARLVSAGQVPRAFNPAGGLHHAKPDRASGFCIFNDAAIAIADLLHRHQRVLYLDLDAHHGDGVQYVFYDSPRVMTISMHESGRFLFPGTGAPSERGVGDGAGYSVNIPLHPGTRDETFWRVFHTLVPPLVESFDPEVVVVQVGVDTHALDPLAHLELSVDGILRVVRAIRDWNRPLVALGGGGYNVDVVARAWTLVLACLAEVDLPDATPANRPPEVGPSLSDARTIPSRGYWDPATTERFADQIIQAVQQEISR
ncbi:MAG: acetoin utilization protein AcuC [Armatimonadota bacterium]|nr:acetoin utilization protein AcuC [Armatimonadota bacterium]